MHYQPLSNIANQWQQMRDCSSSRHCVRNITFHAIMVWYREDSEVFAITSDCMLAVREAQLRCLWSVSPLERIAQVHGPNPTCLLFFADSIFLQVHRVPSLADSRKYSISGENIIPSIIALAMLWLHLALQSVPYSMSKGYRMVLFQYEKMLKS